MIHIIEMRFEDETGYSKYEFNGQMKMLASMLADAAQRDPQFEKVLIYAYHLLKDVEKEEEKRSEVFLNEAKKLINGKE